jgi:hypothetical protein
LSTKKLSARPASEAQLGISKLCPNLSLTGGVRKPVRRAVRLAGVIARSYAQGMTGTRRRTCKFCGARFTSPVKPGPALEYCSQAHRQRAYEARRSVTLTDQQILDHDELTRLRIDVRRLSYDNKQLRAELSETVAEIGRLHRQLHPQRPGSQLPGPGSPITVEPPPDVRTSRRRGWGKSST